MHIDDEMLKELLTEYGLEQPQIALLRHNENITYKVIDSVDGKAYLLRIHEPVTANIAGLQHTYEGLSAELQLLQDMSEKTELIVRKPIIARSGSMITAIIQDDRRIYCSLLDWIEGRDAKKEDLSNEHIARELGAQTAELHQFLRSYTKVRAGERPSYGLERSELILRQISRGVDMGLFGQKEYAIIEESVQLINTRLAATIHEPVSYGVIHADLNMSNILITEQNKLAFIDFGLFGFGFYMLDVAMVALNVPSAYRGFVLEGYFGEGHTPAHITVILEGFMLMAVLGYYAFQMENVKIHPWIRERMPLLCESRCQPLLRGESIFSSF
ncbi:Ser/Thr protein kinase RdoA (MazF antagonist) [Paenibacillus castaneae]|uniref:phosphotransferase enzyme family protein n=1 Tax=Paenibacillus castaneae TaxID=474957 RepID=UPI001FB8683F|nr:phosphotransferase [Paenibacillus castaneae]NIK78940.1 Ser/Thr protein kinase RdoA (MazF antagonist) [Paenibacillus castaneae]